MTTRIGRKQLAAAAAALLFSGVSYGQNWLTDGGDTVRSGWQKDEHTLTKENVKGLKLLWTIKTDVQPHALHSLMTPLVVEDVPTSSGRRWCTCWACRTSCMRSTRQPTKLRGRSTLRMRRCHLGSRDLLRRLRRDRQHREVRRAIRRAPRPHQGRAEPLSRRRERGREHLRDRRAPPGEAICGARRQSRSTSTS
jgi:hypothetical protein